ncbi:MAG: LysR family transcriptional regulator, partial [Betaproteobacteria bacterium HGW-Betaproteobacteria-21]
MDRYTEIRSFTLVAEKGSFAAAAVVEGVTPVVMGRRLDALEGRLGVRLMHRSTRGLTLTDLGEQFLEQCRQLLRDFDVAESSVSEGRNVVRGHLVVSAPAAFGRRHVAPHAPAFKAKYPELRLSFNLTDSVVDLVREGYDMAIRIGEVTDPNYVPVRLFPNRRVVCGT